MTRSKMSDSSKLSSDLGRPNTRASLRRAADPNQPIQGPSTNPVEDMESEPRGELDQTIVTQSQGALNVETNQLPIVSELLGSNVGDPTQVSIPEVEPDQGYLSARLDSLQSAFQQSQETMQTLQSEVLKSQDTMNTLQSEFRQTMADFLQKLVPFTTAAENRENNPNQHTGVFQTPIRSTQDISNSPPSPDNPHDTCRQNRSFGQDEAARQSPFHHENFTFRDRDLSGLPHQTMPRATGLPRGILNTGQPSGNGTSDSTRGSPNQEQIGRSNRHQSTEPPFNSTLREYGPDNPDYDMGPRQLVMNQVPPPTFNGTRAEARAWLLAYEDAQTVNNYLPSQMYARVSPYLKEYAWQWWLADQRQHPNSDWYTFRSRFLKHFSGEDARESLRMELREARQKPHESPRDYFVRASGICLQFDKHMPEIELVKHIAKGLRPETHNILIPHRSKEEWTYAWLSDQLCRMKVDREKREPRDSKPLLKTSSKSPTRKTSQPKDLSNWLCWNCNVTGHTIDKCPKPRDEATVKANRETFKSKRTPAKDEQSSKTSREVNKVESSPVTDLPCDVAKKPFISLKLNNIDVPGRIDTGADMTVVPERIARLLGIQLLPWGDSSLRAANNEPLNVLGKAAIMVTHETKIRPILVAVLSDKQLKQPLWGNDLLEAFGFKIDLGQVAESQPFTQVNVDLRAIKEVTLPQHPLDKVTIGDIARADRDLLEETLIDFGDRFSTSDTDIGRTTTVEHSIELTDNEKIPERKFRIPYAQRDDLERELNRLLATGAIRKSRSKYASPIFFVDKDHGKGKRLVADYRSLNSKTIPDRTPMPHPEDVFALFAGSQTFAKLDITSMFNQVPVKEEDIPKTAISTPFGLFECPLMPFGLINAPATAVRLMREVLVDLDGKICFVYFDDIIVFAKDNMELVQRCKLVLQRIRQHNLKVKPSKCIFAVPTITFLGHVISRQGINIDPSRIEAINNFPVPRNPSEVRSFHGLCSFNRKYIRNFADIAKPLTPLMGKPTDFKWNSEAQVSFEHLKSAMTSAPVLVHFDFEAEHEVRSDASNVAMGAVLYQIHPDPDKCGPVLYFSKTLNSAQRNYSATERELLAAFTAIMEFQHYLYGKRFTLVTDHAALILLRSEKDPHRRLARWVSQLQAFDFTVRYKKGSNHLDADCLSRLINDTAPEPESESEDVNVHLTGDFFSRIISHISREIEDEDDVEEDEEEPFVEEISEDTVDMVAEQRADDYCRKYIDILTSTEMDDDEKARRAKNFTISNELLYRQRPDATYALVIPAKCVNKVLISCHDTPQAAHFGFARVYAMAKAHFFWPKMRAQIKRYVASCPGCQRRKIRNKQRQGLIKPLPIAGEVFDFVGIDLIGPLPPTKEGHTMVLVATDNLSKYAITVPLKNGLSNSICHALTNHLIAIHGCPKVILSDRGANLIGEECRDFFRQYGIRRRLTSAHHPQTNGQTERFNRTLKVALTHFVNENQNDWHDFLHSVTFAYNITEHSVTKIPPFELVFGRAPRIPIDNLLGRDQFIDPNRPAAGWASSEAIKKMRSLILANQQANKRRLDKRLSVCTFKEGDKVVIERPTLGRTPGLTKKLSYTYVGPYKIVRKISDLSFEIGFLNGRAGSFVIHPYHMRHFIERSEEVTDDIIDPTFIARSQVAERQQVPEEDHCERSPDESSNQAVASSDKLDDAQAEDSDDLLDIVDDCPDFSEILEI